MLEDARDSAAASGATLREELRRSESAIGSLISQGSLQSVTSNSASHSYAFSAGTLTTSDIVRAWRDLINLLDLSRQILVNAGTPAPTDAELYDEMAARLSPVYRNSPDLTLLRSA